MTDIDGVPDLQAALSRGRGAVDEHIALAEEFDSSWREETVSEILWVRAAPFVRYADFTKRAESLVGADWLWWWVDADGECYGMLIQAKRIHYHGETDELDLRAKSGQQMSALLTSSNAIGVPAAYLIYSGRARRRRERCLSNHEQPCGRCARRSILLYPALEARLAAFSPSKRDAASMAENYAVALEDLADPNTVRGEVYDLNFDAMAPDLQEFLRRGQKGARNVARTVFAIVSKSRLGQFSATTAERHVVEESTTEIFCDYPEDVAHYGIPYINHLLRGLRSRPPSYVDDIVAGRALAQIPVAGVAGIVVVQL